MLRRDLEITAFHKNIFMYDVLRDSNYHLQLEHLVLVSSDYNLQIDGTVKLQKWSVETQMSEERRSLALERNTKRSDAIAARRFDSSGSRRRFKSHIQNEKNLPHKRFAFCTEETFNSLNAEMFDWQVY